MRNCELTERLIIHIKHLGEGKEVNMTLTLRCYICGWGRISQLESDDPKGIELEILKDMYTYNDVLRVIDAR